MFVVAAHLHDVVNGSWIVLVRKLIPAVGSYDRQDVEVERGSEPTIQAKLLTAELASAVGGAAVEERKPQRLLELVRVISDEVDARHVGLVDLDRPGVRSVEVRVGHRRRDQIRRRRRDRVCSRRIVGALGHQ